jgi:prepilin-type N-terminal cleavage/methylation domain-containing protein
MILGGDCVMTNKRPTRQLSRAEQQANRFESDSPFFARRGFSLIELLIVLGILVVATAFVLPSLTGPLDRSRLRSGAVDVQNAWGKARTLAIREGMPMSFRCQIGGRRWKIERKSPPENIAVQPDEFQLEIGTEQSTSQTNLMRKGRLADGVRFDELKLLVQPTSAEANQNPNETEFPMQAGPATRRWSDPLLFHPEGRSQDARLRIRGADGFVVHVKIRGLTAAVSFTPPFHYKPDRQETEERL